MLREYLKKYLRTMIYEASVVGESVDRSTQRHTDRPEDVIKKPNKKYLHMKKPVSIFESVYKSRKIKQKKCVKFEASE